MDIVNYTEKLVENALNYDLEEALKYLSENLVIRNSGEEFKEWMQRKDIDPKILKAQFGDVNISNWQKGKAISREKAIKLCFALHLDVFEAELFLQKTCGLDWFHMRDYKDLICYVCLVNEWSYEKATELIKEYGYLDDFNRAVPHKAKPVHATHLIEKDAVDISQETDLCEYLKNNEGQFGAYSNTAYDYFKEFFEKVKAERRRELEDCIVKVEKGSIDEGDKYVNTESFEEICDMMRMGIPYGLKKGEMNPLQRSVFDDAPDRQTLVGVYNRTPDPNKDGRIPQIKRKHLIMIWLLANDYQMFEGNVEIINSILRVCGMPMLDSKNPFDWIVLNSLKSRGVERMEDIIASVFNIDPDDDSQYRRK